MDKNPEPVYAQPPRRHFLKMAWISLGFVALGELVLLCLSFFTPLSPKKAVVRRRLFDAGTTESYQPGTVTAFVAGQFYLVCHESGGFLALSGQCTHLGCAVPWDDTRKQFICPCHASRFDMVGNVLSSPAQRALDLFTVTIVNKQIQVDINNRTKRKRFHTNQLVYPERLSLIEARES